MADWRVALNVAEAAKNAGSTTRRRSVVAALDPLGCDAACRQLPAMNDSCDVSALVRALLEISPTTRAVAHYSPAECLAAMRDLGLFLGSIKRHGAEPLAVVPHLAPVLHELARRTDMIPRDTIHHYTEWNPVGPRQRTYTGRPPETVLIDSVRTVLPHLSNAIDLCGSLLELSPLAPSFASLLADLAQETHFFGHPISEVVTQVSPQFFAQVLRPYFEEITVDGTVYLGPAAANIPLFLVDLAVWASDHGQHSYTLFMQESARHTLPRWRVLLPLWNQQPSLVTRMTSLLHALPAEPLPTPLREAASSLTTVLQNLLIFRGKHITIARQAYKEGVALYPTGSGGGDIDLLRSIIGLTRQHRAVVVSSVSYTAPPR